MGVKWWIVVMLCTFASGLVIGWVMRGRRKEIEFMEGIADIWPSE